MYSRYKNTKKQLLVRVCKKYTKSKKSGGIGTMVEYGQFTLPV